MSRLRSRALSVRNEIGEAFLKDSGVCRLRKECCKNFAANRSRFVPATSVGVECGHLLRLPLYLFFEQSPK